MAGDKPKTADEVVAEFYGLHKDEFDDLRGFVDDDGPCPEHVLCDYGPAEGLGYGMSIMVNGRADRPLEQMHARRCDDCPHSACVDCEWGEV